MKTAPPLPAASRSPADAVVLRESTPLASIPAAAWDALATGQPLLSHAFLLALEESGCAARATGWDPQFVTAWQDDALVGALPLYAKAHSYGEYSSVCGLPPPVLVERRLYLYVFWPIITQCWRPDILGQRIE